MTNPRLIMGLLLVNMVVACTWFIRPILKGWEKKQQEYQQIVVTANKLEESGFMSKEDYTYIASRGSEWRKKGIMSDTELSRCLQVLDSQPSDQKSNKKIPLQMIVTERIRRYIKSFTPQQKELIYQYAIRVLAGNGGYYGNDYLVAMTLVEKTRDVRVIPYLLPLTQNKRGNVASEAAETIKYLRGAK